MTAYLRLMHTLSVILARSAALVALIAILITLSGHDEAQAQSGPPSLLLPWQHQQSWLTGSLGYHGTNDAIDFFPPDAPFGGALQCEGQPGWDFEESSYWILASAPGTVEQVAHAYVLIYHGNGWFTRYWHLSAPQVSVGQGVQAGQRLGHPSTLGECATGPHVHYWVSGPNGQTTRNVTLSGRPADDIARPNQWLTNTGNYEPGTTPVPTPPPTPVPTLPPTPTPAPTAPLPTPTPGPTGPPPPTPVPELIMGDANCDGVVTNVDAIAVLRYVAGIDDLKCTPATGEINCDGVVTVADAVALLSASARQGNTQLEPCPSATPRPTDEGPLPSGTPTTTGTPT
jgi:hypothetical protein